MVSIGVVVFMTCVAAAFVFWMLGVTEAIGVWRFWPWTYRLGLKVVEQHLPLSTDWALTAGRLNSTDVKAAVLEPTQILFRAPSSGRGLGIRTPLPIHGAAILGSQAIHVTGRIPLGSTGFFAAWVVGWTTGGAMLWFKEPTKALGFVVLGWLFIGAMTGLSLWFEKRRFRRALEDLLRHAGGILA